jgi:hypothetical protein
VTLLKLIKSVDVKTEIEGAGKRYRTPAPNLDPPGGESADVAEEACLEERVEAAVQYVHHQYGHKQLLLPVVRGQTFTQQVVFALPKLYIYIYHL